MFTYLAIKKYELHLNKRKNHSGCWSNCLEDIGMAFDVVLQLEIPSELQSGIDHTSDSESCNKRFDYLNWQLKRNKYWR